MKARLVAVGERAPPWVAEGFAEYRKRLSHWLPLELVEIEPGLRGKGRDPVRATLTKDSACSRHFRKAPGSSSSMAVAVRGIPDSSRNAWNSGGARGATCVS